MSILKDKLSKTLPAYRDDVKALVKENKEKVVSEVTIQQLFGGMRGVKGLVCDTSVVDPQKGVILRGYSVDEVKNHLPEEIFWLLLTGELPTEDELASFRKEISNRSEVPEYVWNVLRAMPKNSHPMAMYNTGILVMQAESAFAKAYDEGVSKLDLWEPALEDTLTILGRAGVLAAGVYRIRYGNGEIIPADPELDMGANVAKALLGESSELETFTNLMRMFLTVHSDHEAGNASAFTCHTVGSTLADPFYSYSASMDALAGPLHGKANQDVLKFVMEVYDTFGGVPSDEELKTFIWDTLNGGRVVPGYGHAVLRQTDPRFTALFEFGQQHLADDKVLQLVAKLFELVPDILTEHGKAASPYPNVDAVSGALLKHFGIDNYQFYTCLFGVSRGIGVLSQLVLNRALGTAIMRPKSVGTKWVKNFIESK